MNLSPEDLAHLTPDERDAYMADSKEAIDGLQAVADEQVDDAGSDAGGEAADDGQAAQASTDDASAAAAATEPAASEPQPAQQQETYERTFTADPIEDIAGQRKALRAEEAAALKAYQKAIREGLMDGKEDFAEEEAAYLAVKDSVADKLDALLRSETTAEVSARIAQQNIENARQAETRRFLADSKARDGIDYAADKALDVEVGGLVNLFVAEAQAAGKQDPVEAFRWALEQAHSVIKLRHPEKVTVKAAAATPAPASQQPRQPDLAAVPKTLSGLPAAAPAPTGDDMMGKIANLEGDDLEMYLASLPKAQVERLSRGTH
jgi:hypothetical protein